MLFTFLVALIIGGVVGGAFAWQVLCRRNSDRAVLGSLLSHLASIELTMRRLEVRVAEFEERVASQSKQVEEVGLLAAENRELHSQVHRCDACLTLKFSDSGTDDG